QVEKLRALTKYFGVWKPPPTNLRLEYIQQELLPKIKRRRHQDVKFSLECRGKHMEDMNKTEMLDQLYEDIVLEKKILGERLHRRIRQLELEIIHSSQKGIKTMAKALRQEIGEMWVPLREIQAEDMAGKRALEEGVKEVEHASIEKRYIDWRKRIAAFRDQATPSFTPRGINMDMAISGATARAGSMVTPRAAHAATALTAGANHVLMIHRSGQLYTWGVGASGRLGLDLTYGGNPQEDVAKAVVVQAFSGRPVTCASAGYNHSAAVTASGRLFTWGSAATGKLGLGTVERDVYCSIPTRVNLGTKSKVKQISCGAAHTACVTAGGQLFVWGCGDGGRLGLGEDHLGTQFEPVLAHSLLEERVGSVSCGNSHTLVLTVTRETGEAVTSDNMMVRRGGKVYQAGSTNVLGTFCPLFVPLNSFAEAPVKQVSAGYCHSCCITSEGELYAWGNNRDGCLGLPMSTKFATEPQHVSCLHEIPKNLALGQPARQSSVYDNQGASIVVDGDRSGDGPKKCNCTQQDPQGWWEVDLGDLAHITEVKVWNRCDEPSDPSLERDLFSKRLFPSWILASQKPFPDDVGGAALVQAINSAVARAHLREEKRCSVWKCPDHLFARYVRVQMEGFNFLNLAQVEVFGTFGGRHSPGKVTHVCAGKYITTVAIAPTQDAADVEMAYKRAVQADAFNADILRQLETYTTSYDHWGRGDSIKGCVLCKAGSLCEICTLKHEFHEELKELPLGVGGRLRRLNSIAQFLYDREKPSLTYRPKGKKGKGVLESIRNGVTGMFSLKGLPDSDDDSTEDASSNTD
ncbi:unnamed protein product, partial [Discosporangium mesarthrocarpum]